MSQLSLFGASSPSGIIELRPYQDAATSAIIRYLKDHPDKNPIVCAATGTGKSVIIASLIKRVITANPAARIMVCTHVAELVNQNSQKLKQMMPTADIGIYSAGLNEKNHKTQIVFAGIQSIFRAKDIGLFNLLIVDEVHTISKKDKSMWASFITALKTLNPRLRIVGLSATPFRLDSGSLTGGDDALFDDIIYDYGIGTATQDGYLCPLTAKFTKTEFNIEGVGKIGGEYNLKQLEAATNIDETNRKAVAEMVAAAANRRSWLIFCNGIAHSFAIRDEIRRHNITCETVTGDTPDDERDRILQDFKSGKIRAVTNNAVWTTGIDVPNIDMIGMLRHTMSGGLLLQMAGRGTRATIDLSPYKTAKERREAIAASDKPNCLFLDFARNIERHGFLDQIKAKDKEKKGDGVPPMKACPECWTICHAAAKHCKDCGYEFPQNEETKLDGAYNGAVLSVAEVKEVVAVRYTAHNMHKEGKTPCLRVKYTHPDESTTSEYICLMHDGFAKQKAMKWWKERGGKDIGNRNIQEIIDDYLTDMLHVSRTITVAKEGKYDRITRYGELATDDSIKIISDYYKTKGASDKVMAHDYQAFGSDIDNSDITW